MKIFMCLQKKNNKVFHAVLLSRFNYASKDWFKNLFLILVAAFWPCVLQKQNTKKNAKTRRFFALIIIISLTLYKYILFHGLLITKRCCCVWQFIEFFLIGRSHQ